MEDSIDFHSHVERTQGLWLFIASLFSFVSKRFLYLSKDCSQNIRKCKNDIMAFIHLSKYFKCRWVHKKIRFSSRNQSSISHPFDWGYSPNTPFSSRLSTNYVVHGKPMIQAFNYPRSSQKEWTHRTQLSHTFSSNWNNTPCKTSKFTVL